MLTSLNSAVSGLQNFQNELNVIGNNIANANTTGFKASRTSFADSFSQTLESSGAVDSMQIGSGVATSGISTRFTTGTPTQTGVPTDLYIAGDGFFVVRDPATDQLFATRSGEFQLNTEGYLVTRNGYRVQGFNNNGLNARGDIKIDTAGNPAPVNAAVTECNYQILQDGKISVKSADGSPAFTRGQVLLQNFSNPNALIKTGGNLYSGLDLAGPMGGAVAGQSAAPGSNGLGQLQAETLEMSNVDLTTEFASLITTQRAFQANARMVSTSDEVLQELVNLKR
jgi:flagellar hook protein FlgE